MLEMAKRQAQVMQENTKATEAKARAMISVAREKASEEMTEMVVKGYGKVQFGSEKITPMEYIERMTNATSGPDETTITTTTSATMGMKATNTMPGADATTGTTATKTIMGTKAASVSSGTTNPNVAQMQRTVTSEDALSRHLAAAKCEAAVMHGGANNERCG